jgi:hypothetical protein
MKKRKFSEGGETSSDYDEETQARGTAELEKIRDTQPSFKEAFASARADGDKTFEWNGKKYTTEMAKPKTTAPTAPTAEAPAKLKYQSLQDRAKTYEDARAKSGVGMYGTTKSEPKAERKALPLKSTKSETGNKFMGSGYKSGGSVSSRADGIAQRGKTRGKMC